MAVLQKEQKDKYFKNDTPGIELKMYPVQLLGIKADTGMTRIYSAIYKPGFLNPDKNEHEQP